MRASVNLMSAACRCWSLAGPLLVALVLLPQIAMAAGAVDIRFVDAVLLAALVPGAASGEGLRLELADTLVPGHATVLVANDGDACIVSSVSYGVRLQLLLEVLEPVDGGRTASRDEVVSVRLDRPACPGGPAAVRVPLPYYRGVVRGARLQRTDLESERPGTEHVYATMAEATFDRPFTNSRAAVRLATATPRRLAILVVSALLVLTALRGLRSRSALAILWLAVLVLAAWARGPILTLPLYPGTDAFFNHHEAAVVRDTGHYPSLPARMDPGYMFGFHYLLAALMLLTTTEGGIYSVMLLMPAAFIILARSLRLPSATAALGTLVLFLHPYYVGMTSQLMPSMLSLSLAVTAVAAAVALPMRPARTALLLLVTFTVALSHSAGFLYLSLLLLCAGLYLLFTAPERVRALGPCLCAVALATPLLSDTTDIAFFHYGFLAGAALTGGWWVVARIGRPPRTALRPLAVLATALLVLLFSGSGGYEGIGGLTPARLAVLALAVMLVHRRGSAYEDVLIVVAVLLMGSEVGYMSQSTLGGVPLLILFLAAFIIFEVRGDPVELFILLSVPALLWWLPSLPVVGYRPAGFHALRLFLTALPGISLLAGHALAVVMERAASEPVVKRTLLLLLAALLVAGHIDRLAFITVHAHTLLGAEIALSHHPPGDVRDTASFIETRREGSMLAYLYPNTFVNLHVKRLDDPRRFPQLPDRERLTELCSRDDPPLIVVDRILRLRESERYQALVRDLEGTCYEEVHADPTFRVYSARS